VSKTYQVTAKRWAHGWELHIDGVGVTQSHGLHDAERMVRDYIELDLGAHAFDVVIKPEVDRKVDAEIRAARKATLEAAEAVEAAARRSREVARELKEAGLSGRDIAVVLGVSAQRVSQLLAPATREVVEALGSPPKVPVATRPRVSKEGLPSALRPRVGSR